MSNSKNNNSTSCLGIVLLLASPACCSLRCQGSQEIVSNKSWPRGLYLPRKISLVEIETVQVLDMTSIPKSCTGLKERGGVALESCALESLNRNPKLPGLWPRHVPCQCICTCMLELQGLFCEAPYSGCGCSFRQLWMCLVLFPGTRAAYCRPPPCADPNFNRSHVRL